MGGRKSLIDRIELRMKSSKFKKFDEEQEKEKGGKE